VKLRRNFLACMRTNHNSRPLAWNWLWRPFHVQRSQQLKKSYARCILSYNIVRS